MDNLLSDLIPTIAWQWVNLVSSVACFAIGLWLWFANLHTTRRSSHGALTALRGAAAFVTVGFGLVGLASAEVIFGAAIPHRPTEIVLNAAVMLLFLAVWNFHRSFTKE